MSRNQSHGGSPREAEFPECRGCGSWGNLYIADTMNHRIRKVDAKTGIITTLPAQVRARYSGDGGPAVQAAINEPTGLAVTDEALYIADRAIIAFAGWTSQPVSSPRRSVMDRPLTAAIRCRLCRPVWQGRAVWR